MILTDRKRQIVAFIGDYTARYGCSPSFKEIGLAVGVASTSSVAHQIWWLRNAGLVAYVPNGPRTVRLAPGVRIWPDGSITKTVPVGKCWRCKGQHPADLDCRPSKRAAPNLIAGSR